MRRIIAAVIILLSIVLLFTRLGHYALWDDEAVTALAGRGVWQTGDTSVILGHNVVAYRSGLLLRGTHERSTPPLGAYIVAPFAAMSDGQPWVVRFPFATIAIGSVLLILYWLYKVDAHWLTWLLVGMALIGNVSFWLYCRQCRYYSPVIFSSIAVAYLYLNWDGSVRQLVLLAIVSLILLAGNYLNYLALQLCLLADYVIIGRKRRILGVKDWLIVLLPQVVVGGVIVMIWNTLGTGNKEYLQGNTLLQRLELVWLSLRDINKCEYGVGLLLLAAPVLFFVKWNPWLIRGPLVLVIYVVVVSMLSPQILPKQPHPGMVADVRYLAPLIPLCIAIGVMVLLEAARISKWLSIGMAVVAFGTNLLGGSPFLDNMPARSTLLSFLVELSSPPTDPYSPTIAWIQKHVSYGQSIWVQPDFMSYSLMYGAPKAVYAWQFKNAVPEAFKNLPPIHFVGQQPPDFAIAFGSSAQNVHDTLEQMRLPYAYVDHIDVFWHDMYRPELFWHSFETVPADVEHLQAIYIFKYAPGGNGLNTPR